ncbi:hypothetical protein [Halovivax sp.]|uniref:hypothetical protein n=1 Tax=Halovivax sp. TaxID=1935978 RepID=UPI0025C44898|nr:hypothetical protein [Halovivax sp.]
MKRRSLLAGVGTTTAALAGCLSGAVGEDESDGGEVVESERCGREFVGVDSAFPAAAETELAVALEEGVYETEDDLVVPKIIDVDETYLRESGTFYAVEVEAEGDVNRFRIEETLPETEPVAIRNNAESDFTFDVRIEYAATTDREVDVETEGELLVEESVTVPAGREVELGGDVEYRYGMYRAVIEVAELELRTGETWRMWPEYAEHGTIQLNSEKEVFYSHVAEYHPDGEAVECEWTDDGELVAGPGAE